MALYSCDENGLSEMLQGSPDTWKTDVLRMAFETVEELPDDRLQDVDTDKLMQYGQIIGFQSAKVGLKYNQLRRYVDEIKNFEYSEDKITRLKMFRVHLLHGYSRQPNELEPFYKFIDGIIKSNKVEDDQDFEAFVHLIDSITAHFEAFRSDN